MMLSRRQFLKSVPVGLVGMHQIAFGSYQDKTTPGYGPLVPDPNKVVDLPEGFTYRIISMAGETMDDGLFVPGFHDGMAAFQGQNNKIVLLRNHELWSGEGLEGFGAFGNTNELFSQVPEHLLYDRGVPNRRCLGGVTQVVYDPINGTTDSHFMRLAGTLRNCAGGKTSWNTWITCEETVRVAGDFTEKYHGFNFDVSIANQPQLMDPVPLKAMGRFQHEAIVEDPATGIIYQTEDQDDGLFYRFIPDKPQQLETGGKLQALAITDSRGVDSGDPAHSFVQDVKMPVDWVDMEDVESPQGDLRYQGVNKGAARFRNPEGICYGNGIIFFSSQEGGKNRKGQIWKYTPSPNEGTSEEANNPGFLELFWENKEGDLLEYPDNMTFAPSGDLLVCEDHPVGASDVIGVTPERQVYSIARNVLNQYEFTGVTLSPDSRTLFVNIQQPGLTLAISTPSASPNPDFDGNSKVDFDDFLEFARNFGKKQSDSDFDSRFDLNSDGAVNFPDFLTFAKNWDG